MSQKKSHNRDLVAQSDDELLAAARDGDALSYGELWRRHAPTGTAIARRFAAGDLADDLVAEAFTRILSTMQRGGGPISGFRPYLITTIRNVAARWAAKPQAIAVDDFDQFEDPATLEDPAIAALDRTLTLTAFRSLPERWQTVLWYSEVEGLDPHEIAPFLGMTPNATAALSYRARAGLRTAWLQAHLGDDSTSPECRWTTSRLSGYIAGKLTERERTQVAAHLATCESCTIIAGELDNIGSRLAFVLIPLLVGAGVGGSLLTALAHGGVGHGLSSLATSAAPAPQMTLATSTLHAAGTAHVAGAVTSKAGLGVAGWVVAGTVAAGVLTGGGVLVAHAMRAPAPSAHHSVAAAVPTAPPRPADPVPTTAPSAPDPVASDPHPHPNADSGATPAPILGVRPGSPTVHTPPVHTRPHHHAPPKHDTTPPSAPIVTTVIDDTAAAPFAIGGTGEPGATVTVTTPDGDVVATVTAGKDGAWDSGALAGVSPTVGSLSVVQTDAAGNRSAATTVGPIALVPTIQSPVQDSTFGTGPDVAIDLRGWAGATIQVTLDGVATSVEGVGEPTFDDTGVLHLSAINLPPGNHMLGFRYIDGAAASAGQATVEFTITP